MAGVPKGDMTSNLTRKLDHKCTTQSLAAIVAMFLAKSLEFDWPLFSRSYAEHPVLIDEWRDLNIFDGYAVQIAATCQQAGDVFSQTRFSKGRM